jgi:hypothetical protein
MALDSETIVRMVGQICRFPGVRRDLLRHFREAAETGHNSFFQVGGGLTFDGRPCLIHSFEGELYIFQLGQARARRLGIQDMTLNCVQTSPMRCRAIRPLVTLGAVHFSPIPGRGGIAVTVDVIDVERPGETDDALVYAVQMEAHREGPRVTGWAYPAAQPQKNETLSFELESAALKAEEYPVSGPVAVFVSLCTRPQPMDPFAGRDEVNPVQLSNLVGGIVEFQ